jgi:hypothetical protein
LFIHSFTLSIIPLILFILSSIPSAALCAGLYPNLLRVDRYKNKLTSARENNVRFHASSVLHHSPNNRKDFLGVAHQNTVLSLPSDWLMFEEIAKTSRHASVKIASAVSSICVALFAGSHRHLSASASAPPPRDTPTSPDFVNPLTAYLRSQEDDAPETSPSGASVFHVDDWIVFKGDANTLSSLRFLKAKFQALVLKRMKARACFKGCPRTP